MSERVPGGPTAQSETATPPQASPPGVARVVGWLLLFLAVSMIVGIAVGVVWEQVVTLPVYTIGTNGVANTNERGLADMFGSDAWFCVLGFVSCLGLGLLAWRWFHPLGWPMVLVAIAGALSAALVCWFVGYELGPSSFVDRLAAAKAGDVVSVQLTLRTKVSLVIWGFAVVIPILLRASLGRDDEDLAAPEPAAKKTAARADQA